MTNQELRSIRINTLNDVIKKVCEKEDFVVKKRLINEVSYKWGTSIKTIREYLSVLEVAKKIKEENGNIVWLRA